MSSGSTNITNFNNPLNFAFDADFIEVTTNAHLVNAETPDTFNDDFSADTNWTYNPAEIHFHGTEAHLLEVATVESFIQPFDSSTGFVYDSVRAEFTGGLARQKDLQPASSLSWATYTSSINLSYGGGTLTGTATGGAAIAGNKLDLAHNDLRYVTYSATSNGNMQQVGTIKFKLTPAYSGNPASKQCFFDVYESTANDRNSIAIFHETNGNIQVRMCDQNGNYIINQSSGPWGQTSGTTYEFEWNFNFTTGASRLFIDGTQYGPLHAGTGTRSATINFIRIGSDHSAAYNSNFSVEDLIFYSVVSHTANYTPGYTLYENKYEETAITLPEMENTFPGGIISFDELLTTDTDSPKFTLQIGRSGNYLYWDGAAWSTADGTYAQATNKTTFNTNKTSLPVSGEIYGQFKVIFPTQSTQGTISELTAKMEVYEYATSAVYMDLTNAITATVTTSPLTALTAFLATITEPTTGDKLRFLLSDDDGSTWKWITGGVWTVSSEAIGETNTKAEINAGIATFPLTVDGVKIRIYMISALGNTTPTISDLTLNYKDFIYPTTNPFITPNASTPTDNISAFLATISAPAGSTIKVIVYIGSIAKYWSGATWATSNATYAQSSTIVEVATNIATLDLEPGYNVKFGFFLHSDTGAVTPTITSFTFDYDYFFDIVTPDTCLVWDYLLDTSGAPLEGATITVKPNEFPFFIDNNLIVHDVVTTSRSNGYWEINLVETETVGKTMQFTIDAAKAGESAQIYRFDNIEIPDSPTARFVDIKDGVV